MKVAIISIMGVFIAASSVVANVQTYVNDYAGFLNAAGAVDVIDFETLPDGNPTHGSEIISSSFNYDAFGAHFSTPLGQLVTHGNNLGGDPLRGFGIQVLVPFGQRTWITADLTTPATAVGMFFPGRSTLYAYSASGALLAQPTYGLGGEGHFLGVVSDEPIARIVADDGGVVSTMTAFVFTPVPEPATLGLALFGAIVLKKRRR